MAPSGGAADLRSATARYGRSAASTAQGALTDKRSGAWSKSGHSALQQQQAENHHGCLRDASRESQKHEAGQAKSSIVSGQRITRKDISDGVHNAAMCQQRHRLRVGTVESKNRKVIDST